MRLNAVTWNVHKCRGRDGFRNPDRVLDVISALSPDIAILQEADRRVGRERAILDLAAVRERTGLTLHEQGSMSGGGVGWRGNVLLHHPKYSVVETRNLALPSPERRGATVWTLDVEGVHVDVVGLHLALVGAWRTLQAASIAAFIAAREERPTIVAGDTNDWRASSRALEPLEAVVGGRTERVPTFPSFKPVLPLDRIVAGRGARVSSVEPVSCDGASDHLPVAFKVEISPARAVS